MAKNIVICSDGTGNTAIKGRGTNVFKLFEAVDLNGHRADPNLTPQIALYDDGVGTENFKPLKIFAGMTGFGLSRNVRQLYKELARVYDPGDSIFLFGFSRGAFTVRTLAGFIATCGLIDVKKFRTKRSLDAGVREAYRVYRRCYRTKLVELVFGKSDRSASAWFKKENAIDHDVRIRFLGVWDTVDAVGLPFHLSDLLNAIVYRFKFPDRRLSGAVERACHALALDDARHSFRPLLFDETNESNGRIEQVWFCGAHSNVGGGYPKQGMSLVALDWMMSESERAGLRYLTSDRRAFQDHASVDDKLYDPRAGLGMFYRWKIRDVAKACERNGVTPRLHVTVLERIAHGTDDYAPGNLPANATVVSTCPVDDTDGLLEQRARNVQAVLHAAHVNQQSQISRVKPAIVMGLASYYLYLAVSVVTLMVAGGADSVASLADLSGAFGHLGNLVAGLLTPIDTVVSVFRNLKNNPPFAAAVGSGFVAAYLLARVADSRMSAVFSQFWHETQPRLRDALKHARQTVAATDPTARGHETRHLREVVK